MGRVVVFSGSLEVVERLYKIEIRSGPILEDVCFAIFIGVPLIYGVFIFCSLFYGSLSILCKDLIINNNIYR
jgi:hypothetical protein